MAPITRDLPGQPGVKLKTSLCQCVQRRARAPIAREKAARLAGRGIRHARAFDDDDLDAAAGEKKGGAGADHAAAADHNAHGASCRMIRKGVSRFSEKIMRETIG